MAISTNKALRNQVIYQVFTRNYGDGTFRAVEADLDRIQSLGVDIVYLLPIQPSGKLHRKGSMGSPYAIQDYRKIDPVQGTLEDFIHLTQRIHQMGMKVIIDVVYNHTSPDSWLAENHPEWFYRKPDGSFGNRIGDWWDVIDLDYSNAELWDYQIDTLKMWAEYVDGFRCDVAPMVPLEFWKKAREAVETVRPGAIWLGESVEPEFIRFCRKSGIPVSTDGELYQAFDILYDYEFYPHWTGMISGKHTLAEYLDTVNLQETIYPDNYSKLRFLENHDRSRAATVFPEELPLRSWTAWIYFATGTTMLYAGQEYCAEHHPTLFDPDTVDFCTGKDITPLLRRLKEIKQDPIFTEGYFTAEAIGRNADVIFAVRECGTRKCVGIFPTTGTKQSLMADLPNGQYTNLLDGNTVDVFEKIVSCSGEPMIFFVDAQTE